VPLLGNINADEAIATFDLKGIPLVDLPDESLVYKSVARMLTAIL
jgi:CO dehydrogenase nickel-insertion accessory protein CooC1